MTQYPVVAGHEVVGTISQVGDHVHDLEVGQVVGLGWHSGYCNACEPCHAGDQILCATAFTSSEDKKKEALELGAHHTLNSHDPKALEAAAGRFDLLISTVNVKLDWNLYLGTLKPRGRLHFVGATLDPLDINVFSLIMAQRSISGSPVGSPATIGKMLEFALRHNIKPVIETFSFDQINDAVDRLRSGKAHYRVVLGR